MSDQGKKGGEGRFRAPSQRTLVIIPTFNERENLPLIWAGCTRPVPTCTC